MLSPFDYLLVALLVIALPAWAYFRRGQVERQLCTGLPGARLAAYCKGMLTQWLLAALAMGLWISTDRSWSGMGLSRVSVPHGVLGLTAALALGGLTLVQAAVIARRPASHARVRVKLEEYESILPHDARELAGFICLSITAGICEEILYRGVLTWQLGRIVGVWQGFVASALIFGIAHVYLGVKGAVKATLAGAVMAGLYAWTGSLWASMLAHAMVDIGSGWIGYEVLRERGKPDDHAVPPPPATTPDAARYPLPA